MLQAALSPRAKIALQDATGAAMLATWLRMVLLMTAQRLNRSVWIFETPAGLPLVALGSLSAQG